MEKIATGKKENCQHNQTPGHNGRPHAAKQISTARKTMKDHVRTWNLPRMVTALAMSCSTGSPESAFSQS